MRGQLLQKNLNIKISNKNIIDSSRITLEKETDTLNFWFKEFDYDTIYLDIKNKKFKVNSISLIKIFYAEKFFKSISTKVVFS